MPGSLAAGRHGAVYLLDTGNKRVLWFNRDLQAVREYIGSGSAGGRLDDPRGLCCDPADNVWVGDFGSRRLHECNDRLEYLIEIEFRDEEERFSLGRPGNLAVTEFGEIWVADPSNHNIAVLDPVGRVVQVVGEVGSPGGQLQEPSKLVVDRHDRIYVCDRGNRRVVVYDDRGGLVQEIKHNLLEDPVSVALDSGGRIWVLEQNSGRLLCFDRDGGYLSTVGPVVAGADQPLLRPSDLVFMSDGRLVISDTGHDRLLVCRIELLPAVDIP